MTQPPPPPNQPPQGGGFGPPPDQPPSNQPPQPPTPPAGGPPNLGKGPQPGYGYPQTPPQAPAAPPTPPAGPPQPQPGYGYPQTPPQPQPGYGYPGQQPGQPGQPGPYGQPTPAYGQPGQPPGYGYPQATVPMQPQPGGPGGGRKINAQLAIIVAAVVAIALIIGGGVWYSKSSDDGGKDDTASSSGGTGGKGGTDEKGGDGGGSGAGTEKVPSDPAAKVLFQVPAPPVSKDDSSVVVSGSWLTDTVYAKSGVAEVAGYDPDKGSKKWAIKLAGPVCAASRHVTDDNKTVIIHQPAMPTKAEPSHGCTQVAVLDLDAGKTVWTKTAGDQPINFSNVTISGDTVAAGSTEGGVGFGIAKGDILWSPKATDSCYDAGYGGGEKLVAVRKCGSYDARQLNIQTIDPKSGKVISEYKMAQGIEYAGVVSTNPLVVAADVGDSAGDGSGISDFFSIDNKTGKLLTRISAPGEQFAARCDTITKIENCTGLAVGANRLYIPTEEHEGSGESYSRTNEVVAFDLATGKQTGQRADAGEDYTITPLRMDGGNVIAYKRPPYDKGGQIVSIDGGTFKQTTLLENPATEAVRDVEASMSPDYSEILYSQGHLYMSQVFASEPTSADEKEYLAIGFGTSG
ncbi:PQQ-like beta-propeller repeat protein [Streptomyces parvulus]|uniref:outer membrane protein assembly factor BamB family protein n=1 Tax=Streptomyces parvulus TaxID=146923 RepID=UPI001E57ACBD|nr:PQQ-binding-like beta-propeller repeat protein [Streptomyces parvulus]MCC9156450.1 PQQ-like beta-propeller repeat protein [Streptomyces parvulus]MCE7688460.1 PQQ-like beta-propeller repeat protein [Streptomyces parvulus]